MTENRHRARLYRYLDARYEERYAEIMAELPADLRADRVVMEDVKYDAVLEVSREFEQRCLADAQFAQQFYCDS